MRGASRAAAFMMCTWLAHCAWAQEFQPQATLSTLWSDNPQRANVSTGSATVAQADASLRVLRFGPRLDVDGLLGVLQREFVSGGEGSETLPNANINITGIVAPEHFTLTAQDTLGQISTQPFDVLNSTDRQTVNYFSVGPDVHLQFDSRDSMLLNARYGESTYQHSNINNGRYSGELGFAHSLGSLSAVSANYAYERIQYEHSDLYPTVQKNIAFLRYSAQSVRTYLVVEAGEELMKLASDGETLTAPHASFLLQRRISPLMTFNAEFSHTFSDASEALQASVNDRFNVGSNQNVQATASPYIADGGYLMLLRTTPLTASAAQVTFSNQRYRQGSALNSLATNNVGGLNRKLYGGDFVFDRRLSSRWTLSAEVRWSKTDYTNADIRYNVLDTSVHLSRLLGRSVQAGLVYEHAHGTGNGDIYEFKENRVTFIISYAPNGMKSPVFDPVNQFRYYDRPGRGGPSPGQAIIPGQDLAPGAPIDQDIPVSPPQ